jgi:thymidine phosphorylase
MLHDGRAWKKFQQMVQAQHGDVSSLERLDRVHRAPVIREFKSSRSGILTKMDARTVGLVCVQLGAGRAKASDPVDFAVGCDEIVKAGTPVEFGDVLLRIHARSDSAAEQALQMLREGVMVE